MGGGARGVQRLYLVLTLLTTLAASFIWGVNTLFLLDAGLTNTEAFVANAFYTLGMVVFEVPTGVVADTRGRRYSFLLGTAMLLASTLLYLLMWDLRAPLWGWAVSSLLIGLGFTFFSGATEAWLVDALHGRIHGFNVSVAHVWAEQERLLEKAGRRMPVEDSYIAATARRHGLTIATGNDRDFKRPGVKVFNPFKELP